jgi:multidrug efflux pump subunit AcrB
MTDINLSRWAIRHPAVVLFLILSSMVAGAFAYRTLGRAEDPAFTIKTMIVQAAWPGATAEQIQLQVAEPMEKRLQELPQLDYVKTYSRPGVTVLQVQLKDATRGRDVADTWYQVRKKLNDTRGSFPAGVQGPFFNDEYGDVYVAVYMLSGDGLSSADMKRYGEAAQKTLLRVKDVAKVQLFGVTEDKIFVEFSTRKLATLGLTPQAIFDTVAKQNAVSATGAVETGADKVQIRVTGALAGADAIAAVPIDVGGKTFRLGDIATVSRGPEDPPANITRHMGKPAIGFGVSMADGANVLALGEALHVTMEQVKRDLPTGVVIDQVSDQPKVVEESVGEFTESFAEALAIVLIVSFISLGWRTGIVVAMSVPLVLCIVFVVMAASGMNLDRITLGALIIALGLLVDDAIIAVEMMVVRMEQGYDRMEAATFAWTSTAFPMLTGTLVTAAGFLPVGFAKSTAGEYAGNIFVVVGLALVISWFVAVIFTPYLGMKLLPDVKPPADGGAHDPHAIYDTASYRGLRAGVTWAIRHRLMVVAITVAAFVAAIGGMAFVQQQFFPTSSRPELFIETRMPEGSSIRATETAAKAGEALLAGDKDVSFYTTYVGQGAPRFFLALNPVLPNESFALTVIMTKNAEARERVKARLEAAIDAGAVPQARLRIDRLNFGPPVGFPVQFRVVGPDPLKVREIAYAVRDVMRTEPNAIAPQLDWNEQVKNVRLEIDQNRARAFGLSTQDVSQTLATLISGYTISQVREGTNLIDVVARAEPAERLGLEGLPDLVLQTKSGQPVPLAQIAKISYGYEEPILWRRNRDMVLTVRADIAPGVQAPTVTAAIQPKLQSIITGLPIGYRIDRGGAVEESEKANVALFKLFPLMLLAMLTLLMFQVQSFSKLFLVFSTAPLGLIGAVAALLIFNAPFGFVALLGVIALAGILMRNTVILVDQIDHDHASGLSLFDAIIESTVRRSRPVVLTALAAILGLAPLATSVFWGPLAKAMMGGLAVGTVLTLFFLPALYAMWFRVREEHAGAAVPGAVAQTAPPAVPPMAKPLLAAE